MNDTSIHVSSEKKVAVMKRLLLVAHMTEEYCNDKKMLKALANALKQEKKRLDGSAYPLLSQDKAALSFQLAELTDILKNRFLKAKNAEQFRMASTCLGDFIARIEKELAPPAPVEEKSETRQTIDAAIDKAKTLGGAAVDKAKTLGGILGKKIGEGVDKIKKSMRDRDSESD